MQPIIISFAIFNYTLKIKVKSWSELFKTILKALKTTERRTAFTLHFSLNTHYLFQSDHKIVPMTSWWWFHRHPIIWLVTLPTLLNLTGLYSVRGRLIWNWAANITVPNMSGSDLNILKKHFFFFWSFNSFFYNRSHKIWNFWPQESQKVSDLIVQYHFFVALCTNTPATGYTSLASRTHHSTYNQTLTGKSSGMKYFRSISAFLLWLLILNQSHSSS